MDLSNTATAVAIYALQFLPIGNIATFEPVLPDQFMRHSDPSLAPLATVFDARHLRLRNIRQVAFGECPAFSTRLNIWFHGRYYKISPTPGFVNALPFPS